LICSINHPIQKEQLLQTFGKQIPRLRFIPQGSHHHLPHFKVLEATSASKISLRNYADSLVTPTERKVESGGDDHEGDNDTEDERMPDSIEFQSAQHPSTAEPQPQSSTSAGIPQTIPVMSLSRAEEEDFLGKCSLSSPAECAKGWTSEEAGMITLGEVYVMLGSCSTLHFEYKWDSYESPTNGSLISKLVSMSSLLKKKKCGKTKGVSGVPCPNCGYTVCPTAGGAGGATVPKNDSPNFNHRPAESAAAPKTSILNLSLDGTLKNVVPLHHVPLQFLPATVTAAQLPQGSEVQPPQNKSIIILPKGNRRLGRPANRKVIVPRVLPLRPKIDPSTLPVFTITTTTTHNGNRN